MNKLMLICGLLLLGSVPAQENVNVGAVVPTVYGISEVTQELPTANIKTVEPLLWTKSLVSVSDPECAENAMLDLNEIAFIEEEPEIVLGFDTGDYLPEGFDPYELYVDLNAVEFVEEQKEIVLGFNVADYLPASFDPYANPSDIDGINYLEEEEQIELGFDTAEYLPANFDPYAKQSEGKEVTAL
ncbi:MAG: hypothetical protein HKP42_02060 [Maribacter sp.]|nr:hypothetical protein [Maribacter sp.]